MGRQRERTLLFCQHSGESLPPAMQDTLYILLLVYMAKNIRSLLQLVIGTAVFTSLAWAVQVCGIYDAGELSIVEFGSSEVLGSCRMSHISPHTISISLHESEACAKTCIIAHLDGRKNICVTDVLTGASVASINHDAKVDWLVSSETHGPASRLEP